MVETVAERRNRADHTPAPRSGQFSLTGSSLRSSIAIRAAIFGSNLSIMIFPCDREITVWRMCMNRATSTKPLPWAHCSTEPKRDLNVKAAFLHMTADAAVSFGVVVGGIAILLTGQTWWDPAISLAITAVILISTWGLLRDSFKLAVDAVPEAIDPRQVREYLCGLPGVETVHDLHIWGMSTTETALTAHLTMPSGGADDHFLAQVAEELRAQFQIHHSTVQVEQGDAALACQQTCADD